MYSCVLLSHSRLERRRKQDPNAAAVVVLLLNKPKTRHCHGVGAGRRTGRFQKAPLQRFTHK